MSRPLRIEFENAAYHITSRGNERRVIWRNDADRTRFLETLGQTCERFGLVVHAYCLMTNHYHLLAQTPRGNLCRAMAWLQSTYCIRFNRKHHRCGHVLEGRYEAQLIEADTYARTLVRYIHLNPVRPRDRRKPIPPERKQQLEQYPWSSHRAYAGTARKGQTPQWLCTQWLSYWDEGSSRVSKATRAYARDIAGCFGSAVPSPLSELRGGLVLGGEVLWKRVRSLLSDREGAGELRWTNWQNAAQVAQRVKELIADETDRRIQIWSRLKLGGEALAALAREYDYSDASGVHRVAQRLELAAARDRQLRRRLDELKQALSNVKR